MVENKTVGADSISARGTLPTAGRAHIECCALRRQRNFERCASTALHHIYYLLFFIYYLQ